MGECVRDGAVSQRLAAPTLQQPIGWEDKWVLSTQQSWGLKSDGGGVFWGPSLPSTGTHSPQLAHKTYKILPCAALSTVPGSSEVGILPQGGSAFESNGQGVLSPGPALKDRLWCWAVAPQRTHDCVLGIFHVRSHFFLVTDPAGLALRCPVTKEVAEEVAVTSSWLEHPKVPL